MALNYFADNSTQFLRNFFLKSKRSIEKPAANGPAAYVLPADDAHPGAQAQLLRGLQLQHVEISRTSAPLTAQVPAPPAEKDAKPDDGSKDPDEVPARPKTVARTFAAGSYVVRMDQPYSRVADALLDRQYWSPDDPQKHPYDDTGWSMGDLFGSEAVRVTDASILQAPMQSLHEPIRAAGGAHGSGSIFVVDNNTDGALISLRYAFKGADFAVAEKSFDIDARQFHAGSLIVRKVDN